VPGPEAEAGGRVEVEPREVQQQRQGSGPGLVVEDGEARDVEQRLAVQPSLVESPSDREQFMFDMPDNPQASPSASNNTGQHTSLDNT
jgi:hypothetical protein